MTVEPAVAASTATRARTLRASAPTWWWCLVALGVVQLIVTWRLQPETLPRSFLGRGVGTVGAIVFAISAWRKPISPEASRPRRPGT